MKKAWGITSVASLLLIFCIFFAVVSDHRADAYSPPTTTPTDVPPTPPPTDTTRTTLSFNPNKPVLIYRSNKDSQFYISGFTENIQGGLVPGPGKSSSSYHYRIDELHSGDRVVTGPEGKVVLYYFGYLEEEELQEIPGYRVENKEWLRQLCIGPNSIVDLQGLDGSTVFWKGVFDITDQFSDRWDKFWSGESSFKPFYPWETERVIIAAKGTVYTLEVTDVWDKVTVYEGAVDVIPKDTGVTTTVDSGYVFTYVDPALRNDSAYQSYVSKPLSQINKITLMVSSIDPPDKSILESGQDITIKLNGPFDPVTVSADTVFLKDSNGNTVPCDVIYYFDTVELTPVGALLAETRYVVTVKGGDSGIKDFAGNALESDYLYSYISSNKAKSELTIQSQASAHLGDVVKIEGSMQPVVGGAPITLYYTDPKGLVSIKTVYVSPTGEFTDLLKLEKEGEWTLEASWKGDEDNYDVESDAFRIFVGTKMNPLVYVGIALGVVIIALATMFILKKKHHIIKNR
jgi:hypothetical protein